MKRSAAASPILARFLPAIICLLLVSGCAGLSPSFEKPRVSLADIQVHEVKTMETVLIGKVRIRNGGFFRNVPFESEGELDL